MSFHRFPKDLSLKQLWIEKLDRGQEDQSGKKSKVKKLWKPGQKSVVCSNHFTTDCLEDDPFVKYGLKAASKQIRKLKQDAVPTIITHKMNNTKARAHTEARLKRKADQEVRYLIFLVCMTETVA